MTFEIGTPDIVRTQNVREMIDWLHFLSSHLHLRQNGAPSGLEKRGLDASIYHKTKKPTEGTQ
nr:hypothetical protein [Leptospira borgpetersenii]